MRSGDGEPVISTSDDMSKCNTDSLGVITVVRYYFVWCIAQHPGNQCQN